MPATSLLRRLKKSTRGAITVDWVVLTAAIVALGVAVLLAVTDSTNDLAGKIGEAILSVDPTGGVGEDPGPDSGTP